MSAINASSLRPSCRARIMIAVPCVSSAQMKTHLWPRSFWNRTQISVWMYSTRWPMWMCPFAYGKRGGHQDAALCHVVSAGVPASTGFVVIKGARILAKSPTSWREPQSLRWRFVAVSLDTHAADRRGLIRCARAANSRHVSVARITESRR